MVLVVGATGLLGSEICQRLSRRGEKVRALVRASSSAEKVSVLRGCCEEVLVGDLKDPASLINACRGVEAIISTASSTSSRQPGDSIESVDDAGQMHLVDAAKAAGVERFVFVSFQRSPEFVSPLGEAKGHVERAIADLNFTIIEASFFMEVWLSPALGFDAAHGSARIYGTGLNPVSWVSFLDVAEICVLALRQPSAERRTITFGGPEALSPMDVVRRFEVIGGCRFQVEHVPEEALRIRFEAATDPLEKSFAAIMLGYAAGEEIDMAPLQREFEMQLTSVDRFARRALGKAAKA